MKKNVVLFFCFITAGLFAQTTVTIRPNASMGKDALIDSRTAVANTNYGSYSNFASWAWTDNGITYARSLIQFDLSGIPANAIITDAKLSLYCNTTSDIFQLHSGANASYLKRITSAWKEDSVTWNNQPTTTDTNQVSLPESTSQTQNYLNIDVTQLVVDMKNNPARSFGFMIRLQTEATYRSLVFASSDHSDSTKRPVFTYTYTIPVNCPYTLVLQPNATQGKDALIDSRTAVSNTNHGTTADFASWAWTSGGTTYARSLVQFDISSIPLNAVINEAKLSLYCNTTSSITQLNSGSNESYLKRITQSWKEDSVTWNNQPLTTDSNQVSLAQSISQTQDYLNIDVTQLAIDMKNNPSTSFGFMLRLKTEAVYRSMILASSDHSNAAKRPKLSICYSIPLGFTVTSPNGGEKLIKNKSWLIRWNATNASNISILYTSDNGASWNTIIASTSALTGFYNWNIPNILSDLCKIKIINLNDTTVTDISDSIFSIVNPPGITLLSPNGGETWFNNSSQNITWNASYSTKVKLEYSINDSIWVTINNNISSISGFYLWNLSGLNSTQLKVRITDTDFPEYGDTSNNFFAVRNIPQLIITSPNGSETWYNNNTKNITWTSSNSSQVNIAYSTNDSIWIPVATNIVSSAGTYAWALPTINSTSVKVKITDAVFINYMDKSDAVFSILNPKTIIVTSPNGGETWYNNSPNTITWNSTNVANVKLNYTLDNGASWVFLGSTNSTTTGGAYSWNIPPAFVSVSAKIKVTDAIDSLISDMSDSIFIIRHINDGLIQLLNEKAFVIYPNPSPGIFNLIFENNGKPYSMKIFNFNGQLIDRKENITSNQLTIDNIQLIDNKGIYFIEIEFNGTTFRKKMIVY